MSHITNLIQNCFQPGGYPFNRGEWVGPTATPADPVPPMARSYDNVSLSPEACLSADSSAQAGRVRVKDGDTLSQLLADRGYSAAEMYKKDDQGKTMIQRVAESNSLSSPDRIKAGWALSLPSKESQKMESCHEMESCQELETHENADFHQDCYHESPSYGPEFFDWAPIDSFVPQSSWIGSHSCQHEDFAGDYDLDVRHDVLL
jgi:hypothetical protein